MAPSGKQNVEFMSLERSRMSRVGQRDTKPEIHVRRALRTLGVGYRLHVANLPGRPDIVMKGRKKIIEVRGCFWHRHLACPRASTPKTNKGFWKDKFARNVARDARNEAALEADGWDVLTIWECETANTPELIERVRSFLNLEFAGLF